MPDPARGEADLSAPAKRDGTARAPKISEVTAQRIVRDIVERQIPQGGKLAREAEMIEEYGISRASLREALRLLEVQGLIHLRPGPGGGPTVGAVDAHNLARTTALYLHMGAMSYKDLLATQIEIEPLCAEAAARNPDVEAKRRTFARYATSEPSREPHAFETEALGFHDMVFQFSENRVLALLARSISSIVASHVMSEMDPSPTFEQVAQEHRQLAVHIIDGDTSRAHRLMREHYERLYDHYNETMPERLEKLIEWR